jgi:hypothetical protein
VTGPHISSKPLNGDQAKAFIHTVVFFPGASGEERTEPSGLGRLEIIQSLDRKPAI